MLFGIDLTNYAAQKFGPATEYLFMHLFMQGRALFKTVLSDNQDPSVMFFVVFCQRWFNLNL